MKIIFRLNTADVKFVITQRRRRKKIVFALFRSLRIVAGDKIFYPWKKRLDKTEINK